MKNELAKYDFAAEQSMLGACWMNNEIIPEIAAIGKPGMLSQINQILWESTLRCYQKFGSVDLVILKADLEDNNQLEDIGGYIKLMNIEEAVPLALNGVNYAQIVLEKYIKRQIHMVGRHLVNQSQNGGSIELILNEAERAIFQLSMSNSRDNTVVTRDVAHSVLNRVEEAMNNGGETTGLPTFTDWDARTNGFLNGCLYIFAARPSVGKTSLALNIALKIAGQHKAVLIISLEMTGAELLHNLGCIDSGIDSHQARQGKIDCYEFSLLTESMGKIADLKILVDEVATITITELKAKCRKFKIRHDISILIVDYLQLLDGPGENRQQQITSISRGLKAIAKELQIPVIALSQLNRASESRPGGRPRIFDLRESGAIEQDADCVALLHRDKTNPSVCELDIVKQRNGPVTLIKLGFQEHCLRFVNLENRENPGI